MKTPCPKCGQVYEFEPRQFGQMFTCLECGALFRIAPPFAADASELRRRRPRPMVFGIAGAALMLLLALGALLCGAIVFHGHAGSGEDAPENPPSPHSDREIRECIASCDVAKLKELLPGTDLNATDQNGETLLWVGVRSGSREVVHALLTAGCRVNQANGKGETVVQEAVRRHDLPMLRLLVYNGAKLDGGSGETVWGIAAANGDLDIIQYLCSRPEPISESGAGEKALFLALRNGHDDCVEQLLTKYDIETTDRDGNTILLAAVAAGSWRTVKLALERNANAEALNRQGEPAFFLAVKRQDWNVIGAFEESRINWNQTDQHGVTLPMLCIQLGNSALFRKALTAENINRTDAQGHSALFYACRGDDRKILDLLLERKASVRARNFAVSPLREAIVNNNTYAVEKLLKAGAAVDGTDDDGNNALMLVARNGNLEMFQLLAERKFRLFDTNNAGKNAREIASAAGHKEIADQLYRAMDVVKLEQIKPQADALLRSDQSYEQCLTLLDELEEQAGIFQKAKDYVETVRTAVRRRAGNADSARVAEAMASARREKSLDAAIRTLEKAILQYPRADNLDEARRRLAIARRKQEYLSQMSADQIEEEVTAFVESWLMALKRKRPTEAYWSRQFSRSKFELRSWEILGVRGEWSALSNTVEIEVELEDGGEHSSSLSSEGDHSSLSSGGSQTRKKWTLFLERDDDMRWKIRQAHLQFPSDELFPGQ